MTQETLNFDQPAPWHFDGKTYSPKQDQSRLSAQLTAVFSVMRDAKWRTLTELSSITGASEASVSARLRDLRKARFGSHTVNRRRLIAGLFTYQLIINE